VNSALVNHRNQEEKQEKKLKMPSLTNSSKCKLRMPVNDKQPTLVSFRSQKRFKRFKPINCKPVQTKSPVTKMRNSKMIKNVYLKRRNKSTKKQEKKNYFLESLNEYLELKKYRDIDINDVVALRKS